MCGIAGQISLTGQVIPRLEGHLNVMSEILAHRGPDGGGVWLSDRQNVGLMHRRLSIIDLSKSGAQPMRARNGAVISYNGEIYNYPELRAALKSHWNFESKSDTECILAAYDRYGVECLSRLRGMFSFALWDAHAQRLFCARDRFGIKPFFYCQIGDVLSFASEPKALLPFLPDISTDEDALAEYLTFQYTLGDRTLFEGVKQLMPGHGLVVERGKTRLFKYWDVSYEIDYDQSPQFAIERVRELVEDSVAVHLRSDVAVGSYISGGVDSSLIFNLAQKTSSSPLGFHGRFTEFPGYDESPYAHAAAAMGDGTLHVTDISARDFLKNIEAVIYHLDFPVAGPGSFPQFMVSQLAAQHVKVVLGGQGGDEIFGGYARYVIAYLEQCLKANINGTSKDGNFVVTLESIMPNLGLLKEYVPLIKRFWAEGLFDSMEKRYFRLIDRSVDLKSRIDWGGLDMQGVFGRFSDIFSNPANVEKEAYFDKMTHFDFKCLLPALLQVEDRMSMAHGLESRVPLLDHDLVEFAATIPAKIKFQGGKMKHVLRQTFPEEIPPEILHRRDKMGFPVPLQEWYNGDLREFINDTLDLLAAKHRPYINGQEIRKNLSAQTRFSREIWGLLSLELWWEQFQDESSFWAVRVDGAPQSDRINL